MFKTIRYWFFLRRFKYAKQCLFWETEMDKKFLESEFQEQIDSDDTEDRETLLKERSKEADKQDQTVIADLEEKISRAKAIKQTYRRTLTTMEEVDRYIKSLDKISWLDLS